MRKLYIALLLGSIFNMKINAQVLRVATSPTAIANQIPGFNQISTIATRTFSYTPSTPPSTPTPVDEDSTTEDDKLYRYADILPVNILMSDGNLTSTSIGKVWTLRISIPNAVNVGFVFNQFNLSASAEMYVFNEARTVLDSGIKKSHFQNASQVAIFPIKGTTAIIYIVEPNNFGAFQSSIQIQKLEAGFQEIDDVGDVGGGSQRATSINCDPMIMCEPNRMNQARAVARFVSNGYQGTGTLINNEANNGRSFFLTAFHVIDVGGGLFGHSNGVIDADEEAALANARFQFQFWRTSCNGTINNAGIQFTGAVLRANWKNSDVVLLELTNPPGIGDGINYAGWNRQTGAPSDNGSFIIHHPEGEDMRVTSTRNVRHWFWNNMFWTAHYSLGTVAKGSSGSALFNEYGQIVGQLRSGWSSCNFTDFGDRYGKFNHSWNGAGLQQWLSPNQGLQNIETLVLSPLQIRSYGDVNCTSSTTFFVPTLLGCTYFWTTSPNLQIVVGQNSPMVSVMAIGGSNTTGTLSVTIIDSKGRNRVLTVTTQVTVAIPIEGEFSINGNYGNYLSSFNWIYGVTKARLTTPGIISTEWYFDSGDWPVYYQNNPGGELEFLIEGDQTSSFRAISQTNCGTQYNVYTFHRDGFYSYRMGPNPTTSTLTLSIKEELFNKKLPPNKGLSIQEIIVMDKLGNMVLREKYPLGTKSITLFVGSLKTDVYTIRIFNGTKWTSEKFIKQ